MQTQTIRRSTRIIESQQRRTRKMDVIIDDRHKEHSSGSDDGADSNQVVDRMEIETNVSNERYCTNHLIFSRSSQIQCYFLNFHE
jgi:hypothetical protein